jgi:hypothetical protein
MSEGRRRQDCSDQATQWHSEAPFCAAHKPVPRYAGEERRRLEIIAKNDERLRLAKEAASNALRRNTESAGDRRSEVDDSRYVPRDEWPDIPTLL